MNALGCIEGRQLLPVEPFVDWFEDGQIKADAIDGSRRLRDAILRAKGILPPPPMVRGAPVFKERKVDRRMLGLKRGFRKVRVLDERIIRIQELVAEHFKISAASMREPTKKWKFARPRQVAIYLAHKRVRPSYADNGFNFGRRDHTTIIHAIRQVEQRIREGDQETLEALHAVYAELGA